MAHPQVEQLEKFLEEAKNGYPSSLDEFFLKLWESGVSMAGSEILAWANKVYEWLKPLRLQQPENFAKATMALGFAGFTHGNYEQALLDYTEAQKLFQELKDEDGVQACNVLMGGNYRSLGELELTLKYNLEGFNHLVKVGVYKTFQLYGVYTLAETYNETSQFTDALKYYFLYVPLAERYGNEFMAARGYEGIAVVYQRQKKYSLALEYFNKALDLCVHKDGLIVKSRILTDMGVYYFNMGDYETAIKYQEQALSIREEIKVANAPITNLMHLGEIYQKQGRFDEALAVLHKGLLMAEQLKVKMKIYQIHKLLSDIYLAKGDPTKCFFHHKAFHEIKEEVQHEDNERKIKNLHLVFEAEQTKKENVIIKAQKQEIENKNQQLQETIDELTITKISRKAKGVTLIVGIVLIAAEEPLMAYLLKFVGEEHFILSLGAKIVILLSLKPIDKAIERYMLRRLVLRKRSHSKEVISDKSF